MQSVQNKTDVTRCNAIGIGEQWQTHIRPGVRTFESELSNCAEQIANVNHEVVMHNSNSIPKLKP